MVFGLDDILHEESGAEQWGDSHECHEDDGDHLARFDVHVVCEHLVPEQQPEGHEQPEDGHEARHHAPLPEHQTKAISLYLFILLFLPTNNPFLGI